MLYRDAAVRISQTVLLLSRELSVSADQMFEYQQEGKVTEEQAATPRQAPIIATRTANRRRDRDVSPTEAARAAVEATAIIDRSISGVEDRLPIRSRLYAEATRTLQHG